MYEGEVTYSGSGSAYYDTGDTADPDKLDVDYHTNNDPDYYSRIDPEETVAEMAANNLNVYATFLAFAGGDDLGWDNLYDLSAYRYLSGTGPALLIGVLEEPDPDADDPRTISDLWDEAYVGGESSIGTGFAFLNTLEAFYSPFPCPNPGCGMLLPEVLALEEIDNWAHLPHRPPGTPLDTIEERVPVADVQDLIEAIQPLSTSGLGLEAWSYLSEKGALMVATQAYAFGGDVQHTTGSSGIPFGDGDHAGLTFPLYCRKKSVLPGGVAELFPGTTAQDYVETLSGVEVSFLHLDLIPDVDPGMTPSENTLVLQTFLSRVAPATTPILLDEDFDASSDFDTSVSGHPFENDIPEVVELIRKTNLLEELSCLQPTSPYSAKDTFHIRTVCHAGSAADCDDDPARNFGYVADVEVKHYATSNCNDASRPTPPWPSNASSSPFVVTNLPPALVGQNLPAVLDGNQYIAVEDFFPWVTAQNPGFLKLPLSASEQQHDDLADSIDDDPVIGHFPFCFPRYTKTVNLDTQASPDVSQTAFLSTPNTSYRYLDLPAATYGTLDGVIVRYGQGMTEENAPYFDNEAQQRLMAAIGKTTTSPAPSTRTTYVEAMTWINNYSGDWLAQHLNNAQTLTDGFLAGDFSSSWTHSLPASDKYYGEFTERSHIHTVRDANATTSDPNTSDSIVDYELDDYELGFFYPKKRKDDSVPGWYQTFYVNGVAIDPETQFSFDWDIGACSGCVDDDGMPTPDMALEFTWEELDNNDLVVDSGTQVWILGETYAEYGDGEYAYSSYSGLSYYTVNGSNYLYERPEPVLTETGGKWNFRVTMYSIAPPDNRRFAYFRLIKNDAILTTGKNETIFLNTPGSMFTWEYESGMINGSSYPFLVNYSDYTIEFWDDSWSQSPDINECFHDFFADSAIWEDTCSNL